MVSLAVLVCTSTIQITLCGQMACQRDQCVALASESVVALDELALHERGCVESSYAAPMKDSLLMLWSPLRGS